MFLIAIEKIFPGIFRDPYRLHMRGDLNSTQLNSQIQNIYKTELKEFKFFFRGIIYLDLI